MRWILLTFFFCLSLSTNLLAQNSKKPIDTSLKIKQHRLTPDFVYIDYSIPLGGMVEVKIFNAENTRVWREQYIRSKSGDATVKIPIKTKSGKILFTPGSYNYTMNYKGVISKSSFTFGK
ncbi:MAG: hypothetical protein LC115_01390 [Bacteroidia bacterium]|nr:hypothetical protein [Bacteroidia bacterium]